LLLGLLVTVGNATNNAPSRILLSAIAIVGAVLWVVHEALRARKIFELAQQPAMAGPAAEGT
jgi:hypothetical protein